MPFKLPSLFGRKHPPVSSVVPPPVTPSSVLSGSNKKNNSLSSYSVIATAWDDANDDKRARFTLENILDRYGRLRNMRANLFAYSSILFATQLFIVFWKTRMEIVHYDEVSLSEHRGSPLCCCAPTSKLKALRQGLKATFLDTSDVDLWHMVAFIVTAISSPLWEKCGRLRMVLLSLPISSISLFILCFIWEHRVVKAMIFVQTIAYSVIYLASLTSLFEMMPRDGRSLGVIAIQTARTHCFVLTSIFATFPSLSPNSFVIPVAVFNAIAFFIALRFADDSLCHLIVQGRIAETDKRVMREEISLMRDKDGTTIDIDTMDAKELHYFKRVVQLITDDLAFDEDDMYTKREFLTRLFKSKSFYRLLYTFFGILLAGVVDGLCQVYLKEIDLEGSAIVALKIVAKVGSVVGLCAVRKWPRLRSAKTIMVIMTINLAIRGTLVQYDTNYCTNNALLPDIQLGSGVLATSLYLFNDILIYSLLLSAFEQTPSRMRIPGAAFYVLLMEVVKGAVKSEFPRIGDIFRMSIVCFFLCLLIIIAVVFRKVLDEDSFNVFTKDLIKERSKNNSQERTTGSNEDARDKTNRESKAPFRCK